jgi:hypothetical protein
MKNVRANERLMKLKAFLKFMVYTSLLLKYKTRGREYQGRDGLYGGRMD